MSRRLVYRLIYVPSLCAIAAMVILFAHPVRSHAAFSPKEMIPYAAEDKSFAIQYPRDWQVSASTLNGTGVRAHFRRDPAAEVVVTCDLTGSLIMDMSRANANMSASLPGLSQAGTPGGQNSASAALAALGGKQKTPLEAAHEAGAGYMQGKFRHYVEQPAVKSQLAGGEALTSAFTAKTADFINTQEIVGRHVTVLAGNRPVTLDAYCSKGEEEDLFRVFDAMLKTLQVSATGG